MRLRFWKTKEEKEFDRKIQATSGKKTVERYVRKQVDMLPKLREMGREALRLEDQAQFHQLLLQFYWTEQQITRWKRYLLTFEMVESRRDQARSTREFLSSLQAMGRSMLANASPRDIAEMQKDLQIGLAHAEGLEERMKIIMESADDYVAAFDDVDSEAFEEARATFERAGQTDALDDRIAEGLKRIEAEMRHESR